MNELKFIRTIEVDFAPTVEELASVFAHLSGEQQAAFFAAIKPISATWPGAGWCQQSYDIVKHLDADGRDVLETLAAHLLPDDDELVDLFSDAISDAAEMDAGLRDYAKACVKALRRIGR